MVMSDYDHLPLGPVDSPNRLHATAHHQSGEHAGSRRTRKKGRHERLERPGQILGQGAAPQWKTEQSTFWSRLEPTPFSSSWATPLFQFTISFICAKSLLLTLPICFLLCPLKSFPIAFTAIKLLIILFSGENRMRNLDLLNRAVKEILYAPSFLNRGATFIR